MKNKFELLAPGGDIDSIKAAILAGADAVYCGLIKFNARNRAANINFEDLNGILNLAHKHNCKVFLTLNIIILESEIPALVRLLNKVVNTKIDGVIVQDSGLFYLLSKYFKDLEIHASTQCTTHNKGQILFLNKLAAARVNLSRELNIDEIKELTPIARENNISIEVFVHGSYCISFSGLCYISSILGGNSGNRGRCSQPCRDRYMTTPAGKDFPLNLKDNSAYFDLKGLYDAGVDSLKIEGRIKKFHYVYTVVNCWKKQILNFYDHGGVDNAYNADNTDDAATNTDNTKNLTSDNIDLYKVFNRDFSNAYLKGDINKHMFIDNPRDNSAKHLFEIKKKSKSCSATNSMEKIKQELYDEKTKIITTVKDRIKDLSIAKTPLTISISGKTNAPLKISAKTPETSFAVFSKNNLINADKHTIEHSAIEKRFKSLNNTKFYIEQIDLKNLQKDLFIPFQELTSMKNEIAFLLNGSKPIVAPIKVPVLNKQSKLKTKPSLCVLISSPKDLYLCNTTSADIYYKLPDCLENKIAELIELFQKNKNLIAWFPPVLIGKSYTAAVEFLKQVQPKLIVTNNTGIAYKAYENKIAWIAGPYLNNTNSFSLLCIKEKFNCCGSFISNEINKNQIKRIVSPDDFKLYYSIYHPILLLTSRQCLFHQTIGCKKNKIDDECIQECNKSCSITNLKKVCFLIDKKKGDYHCMYNNINFLNTDIITDLPDLFSGFFIDLRDIKTGTKIDTMDMDKSGIVRLFENLINGSPDSRPDSKPDSKKELKQIIHPSTNAQYKTGI
ncbi:peptidase U32 family protein [Desulfobacula phenolica]|uniref:Putative protease n=1 Tax=Desulfobacula phenolica TaxID=90732 RepID=A0A1H2DN81_9BACT|nr:peptidase U32 family protein [Desulfobacula phenolica]SDT84362.1 putative protease [Desulfobacula phenolica]